MDDIFVEVDADQPIDNPLEVLVGEGKRFSSVEELAKAKLESDRFIKKLEAEAAELRQEVSSKATIDEILTQIRQSQKQPEPSTPPAPQAPGTPETPDFEKLVESMLTKKERENRALSNAEIVSEKLKEKFGADAPLHINQKAKELGMTVEQLKAVARENPKAFFKLTDLDRQAPQLPTAVTGQSRVVPPQTSGGRDKAYYQKLKAANKQEYFSEKVQLAMYKDMEAALKAGKDW